MIATTADQPVAQEKQRLYFLDFLKGISIAFVLLMHLDPLSFKLNSSAPATNFLGKLIFQVIFIFNSQVALIAVPTFLLVSLFLFFGKSNHRKGYFRQRFLRIFGLYGFYTALQFLLHLVTQSALPPQQQFYPNINLGNLLYTLTIGGPPLPNVSESSIYYLFALLCLVTIAHFYQDFLNLVQSKALPFGLKLDATQISLAIVILDIIYFEAVSLSNHSIPFNRIDNFLGYLPIAYLLRHHLPQISRYSRLFGLAFLGFQVHNLILLKLGFHLGIYSRVSLIVGSIYFFCFAYRHAHRFQYAWITFLAQHSLGIFTFHRYFQVLCFMVLIPAMNLGRSAVILIPGLNLTWEVNTTISAVIALVGTLTVAWGLGKSRLRMLVA